MSTSQYYQAFSRFFVVCVVLFVHSTSSHLLHILPQTTPALSAQTQNHTRNFHHPNDLTADENIANLLRVLASHPRIQFSQAGFLGVVLTAGGRGGDRTPSADINAFRKISLHFRAGGITPATPLSHQYFAIRNSFPEQWEEWRQRDFFELPPFVWLEDRHPLHWAQVQRVMPIAFADSLLKDAGYAGSYEAVLLHEMERRPLQYCFQGMWPGPSVHNVVVELFTGIVEEVGYACGIELQPRGG